MMLAVNDDGLSDHIASVVCRRGRLTFRKLRSVDLQDFRGLDRETVLGVVEALADAGRLTVTRVSGLGHVSIVLSAPGLTPDAVRVLGYVQHRERVTETAITFLDPRVPDLDEVLGQLAEAGYITESFEPPEPGVNPKQIVTAVKHRLAPSSNQPVLTN